MELSKAKTNIPKWSIHIGYLSNGLDFDQLKNPCFHLCLKSEQVTLKIQMRHFWWFSNSVIYKPPDFSLFFSIFRSGMSILNLLLWWANLDSVIRQLMYVESAHCRIWFRKYAHFPGNFHTRSMSVKGLQIKKELRLMYHQSWRNQCKCKQSFRFSFDCIDAATWGCTCSQSDPQRGGWVSIHWSVHQVKIEGGWSHQGVCGLHAVPNSGLLSSLLAGRWWTLCCPSCSRRWRRYLLWRKVPLILLWRHHQWLLLCASRSTRRHTWEEMRLDIEPHLARIWAIQLPFSLSLMEIPVSLDPAAISLSDHSPGLVWSWAITEDKGFIVGRVCIKNVIIIITPITINASCIVVANIIIIHMCTLYYRGTLWKFKLCRIFKWTFCEVLLPNISWLVRRDSPMNE